MDEEQYFQQFDMSGMTPDQQKLFKTVMWGAATYTPGMANKVTGEEEGERPLSSYSSDVQNLIRDYRFQDLFSQATNEQYAKILRDAGISSEEWFANNPEGEDETPYALKVLRAANYNGINESESFYSNPKNIASEEDRDKALEELREEAMRSFESSYLFPDLGGRLNEIVPEEIRNSPEKMRDFELAFRGQFGIGLDFDESGRVGDLYTDNVFGNAFRQGVKYPVMRLAAATQKMALDYGVAAVDILRGDEGLSQEARDLKFRISQQEGKDETYLESAGASATSPSLFYAALFSPEARRQLLETSAPPDRTRDIEQLLEDPSEVGIINGIGIAVDMLIDSAPIIAEIGMSMSGAGAILKGGTKAIAKKAAKKAAKETLYDPATIARTGVLKDAAAAAEKARKIQSRAAALSGALNKTGGFLLADVLVASHVHADNSSEDWYQNLEGAERAWFLANQSSAEVASGMVLGGILGGNGIISKASQALFKGQKKAINSFARSVVESTFFGIAEEGVTEGITAGWQYFSEIEARKNGGDSTAIFDQREFIKRVKDGAVAGALMGGVAGFGGGLVKGAAKAAMSKFHPEVQKLKKELDEAAQAMDNAVTEEQKTQAKESIQDIISKYAGAQSSVVRAYVKLAEANPETFEEIARIQGMINAEVTKYRNGNYSSNEKSNARKRVKRLVQKKNDLQNKAISESTAEGLADFTSFDDLVNSEAEAVAQERGYKFKQWKQSPLATTSEQTTALLKEEREAMSASLEAAQAVNSQEQNADDDLQDSEGQTQGDLQARREAAEDNSLEGDADNQFAPSIDEDADVDDRVKSKYRDVIGTVNNLMRGFKRFGIKVVLHKTSDSYLKATGKTGRGVFFRDKSTKTIHMDLEKMALGGEVEGLEGVYDTPTHEFLHLAFTTADVATLKRYKAELLGLARRVGLGTEAEKIFAAVEDSYRGKPEGDVINEQVTNALERLINALPEAKKPGFIEGALRAFLRVFGLEKAIMGEQITPTDFLNFIKEFKQARDEGVEFKREEIPVEGAAETESRDINIVVRDSAEAKRIGDRISDRLGIENIDDYPGDPNLKSQAGKHYLVFTPDGLDTFSKEDIQRIQREAELVTRRKMKVGKSSPQEMSTRRPAVADMESRDLGMRQPSRAYPDLINKVVNYRVYYLDKLGGQQSYQTNGLRFNDYWHFRNWYLKETGNGKMANNLGQFTYTGDDGTIKKINPPKPKRDRDTGEIIDMEPRLRTPQQRKLDKAEASAARRKRFLRYVDIRKNAGDALKFAVGKIRKIDKTGEIAFYNEDMLLEQDSQSELPVVYSETFFTEGLNVDELDQLGTDFGNNLEFLIPTTQEADFAFTVRNNGDGTVTIDAHSDVATDVQTDTVQSVEVPSDTQSLESVELESDDLIFDASAFAKRELPTIRLIDMIGKFLSVVGYDGTNYEGESGIYQDTPLGYLLSFSTKRKAKEGLDELRQRAIDDYNKRKKEGDDSLRGSIFVAPVVMGEGSMLSNKRVCKEVIKLIEESNLTDAEVAEIFNALLKDNKKHSKLKSLLGAADMMLDTGRAPEGFKNVNIGKKVGGVDNTYTMPVTKTALIQTLESANNVRSMTTRNNIFSFVTGTSFGSKSINQLTSIRDLKNSELAREGLVGVMPLIKEYSYELELVDGRLELAGVEIDSPDSRKDLAFPVGIKVKEGSIKEFQPEKRLTWLDLLSAFKRSGKRKSIGQEVSTAEKAYQRAKDAVKNARISDSSRQKVDTLYSSILENRKGNLLTERDEVQLINNENLNKSEEAYLKRLTKRDAARKERDSIRSAVKASERSLLGAEVTRRVGAQESIDLALPKDPSTNLPFEPNNLNAFQAFMARVDQLFANKYANVFSLQRAIEGAKKAVVDISQDFINAETLMYGKTANDLEKLDEKVKVISQEMKDAGLIGEDVSQFLIARHAEERNALIAERTDGETLSGSGMSNERAQEVMDSFSPEKKAALESIAKKVDAITKDTRQTMVKFGLESQETIDAFEAMFDNYVPLGGLSTDEMSADTSLYPTGGAGMSIYGDTTRRAKGRASEANNVLAQAIAQNAAVHAKARKNEALSSLYNLVEANPNTKVWRISSEVPFDAQSAVGVRVNGDQKFIVFTNADHAKALKNMGVEKLDLFSKVMRSFSGFLRRSFTTANPEFIISNFARDIQSALFNAMAEADIPGGQIQSKYIATKIIERVKQTLPALLKGAVGKDLDPEMAAYFEEFKEDGGQTGWGFVKDVGTIAAEIEAEVNEKNKAQKAREWMMKNSIDVVENVNDAFENSIRLAAYMEARKAGASREKAAELAKNITVNFNRSGELGAVANAWYMFFNASVQGTVRLARSLGTLKDVRKPNGELESWHNRLNAAQKMAFGLSLTTGMLTAINLAMSDEDEDGVLFYNKIPDYEKERNLIIMYDGQNYLKIPLPYGFNVFANMGSAMAEVAGGQRDMTDAGMFLLNSAFSSFSPISFGQSKDAAKYLAKGATPTIFKPLVDIAVNESYFGSSVYKEQFPVGAPKPEAEMSFRSPEGVRKFFQWMNEATGGSEFVPGKADFNPDKFWYGFEYYIGGAGQFVTRTLGTGRDTYEMIKEGEKVPMKANDFPFLRKIYGEFSKYYDSDVYVENADLVSQLYKERKEAENKNDKRYRGIMKLESARKKTEKQIKRLRELRKEARDIKNYVERQNRIYELYEKERSLLMQFNKQFEQLRGQD
jgi:hypothetical protein